MQDGLDAKGARNSKIMSHYAKYPYAPGCSVDLYPNIAESLVCNEEHRRNICLRCQS